MKRLNRQVRRSILEMLAPEQEFEEQILGRAKKFLLGFSVRSYGKTTEKNFVANPIQVVRGIDIVEHFRQNS